MQIIILVIIHTLDEIYMVLKIHVSELLQFAEKCFTYKLKTRILK